jgi:putative ABC transport system permease protein
MLEIKDLYKVYKPKNGTPVVALNHISLTFPETGLIFILGKSGSGKSTLLNVMGGLDKADSGEIIIQNKSSKDFSQDDFDSYRNTYLGFIFQEYNILNEFNIHDNIALALQLQNKPAKDEAINAILKEVDLEGFGKRKTNELSGGQKQRVAIARALVKNPSIIFADEPTGALDSKTGQAVFDTLKKLSQTKLVIVVSHDRDFAEQFGDRVIELKDGNVISDITKTALPLKTTPSGLTLAGDVIAIGQGHHLTAEDLSVINTYIDKNPGESFISLNPTVNKDIREKAHINASGQQETFVTTDPKQITRGQGEFKVIRSKLPFRNCLAMAQSSLKVKPVRLVITILLCLVSFTLFGLADTMAAYDKYNAATTSILDSQTNYASFRKMEKVTYENSSGSFTMDQETNFSEADLKTLKDKTDLTYRGVFADSSSNTPQKLVYGNLFHSDVLYSQYFYPSGISGLISVEETTLPAGSKLAYGKLPQAENEIAFSLYDYEVFAQTGYAYPNRSDGSSSLNTVEIKASDMTPEKLIGNKFTFSNQSTEYTLTGILDTGFDETKYAAFKSVTNGSTQDLKTSLLLSELTSIQSYSYHCLGFLSPSGMKALLAKPRTYYLWRNSIVLDYGNAKLTTNYLSDYDASKTFTVLLDPEKTSLSGDEVVPAISSYANAYATWQDTNTITLDSEDVVVDNQTSVYPTYSSFFTGGIIDVALSKTAVQDYEDFFKNHYNEFTYYSSGNPLATGDDDATVKSKKISALLNYLGGAIYRGSTYYDSDIHALLSTVFRKYYQRYQTNAFPSLSLTGSLMRNGGSIIAGSTVTGSIVGFSLLNDNSVLEAGHDFLLSMIPEADCLYAFALSDMPTDTAGVRKLVNLHYGTFDDKTATILYLLNNPTMDNLTGVNFTFESLSKVFLYLGLGFAVFASLMLANFISVSIASKKREIGILRAVGARGRDVFHIFFTESMIITLINYVLTMIALGLTCFFINRALRTNAGLSLTILILSVRQFAIVLAVCLLVAFLASFLPVFHISHKRPIDAIQNR